MAENEIVSAEVEAKTAAQDAIHGFLNCTKEERILRTDQIARLSPRAKAYFVVHPEFPMFLNSMMLDAIMGIGHMTKVQLRAIEIFADRKKNMANINLDVYLGKTMAKGGVTVEPENED